VTISLNLPKEVEQRLLKQVREGRHQSLEEAILEKLSQGDDPDLLAATGMEAKTLSRDMDEAWTNRAGAVDGETVFDQIRARSAQLRAQGK